MNYGFTITELGWNLLSKLLTGDQLKLTRIMVGSGRVTDTTNPASLTDLIAPVAPATSTAPIINGKTISFVVEYRSDLNGGLEEGFWLNEFGIYAEAENGEIMLYYGTLGDYPQYVTPYTNGSVDIRRYPVSITLSSEIDVVINYNPDAFVTSDDLENYISSIGLNLFAPLNHAASHAIGGYDTIEPESIGAATTNHTDPTGLNGVANNHLYGHVKLTDNANTDWDVNDGIAATPIAVKTVNDSKADINHTHNGLLPSGGATGQLLAKRTSTDNDVEWVDTPIDMTVQYTTITIRAAAWDETKTCTVKAADISPTDYVIISPILRSATQENRQQELAEYSRISQATPLDGNLYLAAFGDNTPSMDLQVFCRIEKTTGAQGHCVISGKN